MSLAKRYYVTCPYCLEQIEVIVDNGAGHREYTEDCEVCCNPILFMIEMDNSEVKDIQALRNYG